jgi:hypothetical protein
MIHAVSWRGNVLGKQGVTAILEQTVSPANRFWITE